MCQSEWLHVYNSIEPCCDPHRAGTSRSADGCRRTRIASLRCRPWWLLSCWYAPDPVIPLLLCATPCSWGLFATARQYEPVASDQLSLLVRGIVTNACDVQCNAHIFLLHASTSPPMLHATVILVLFCAGLDGKRMYSECPIKHRAPGPTGQCQGPQPLIN